VSGLLEQTSPWEGFWMSCKSWRLVLLARMLSAENAVNSMDLGASQPLGLLVVVESSSG